MHIEYGDKVQFIIIHTREAHAIDTGRPSPYTYDQEGSPIYEPKTYEERVELARKTVAAEGITVPVLVDEMDNPLGCTYGPAPNIAYLIGTEGKIIVKQSWYDPEQMESAILAYIADGQSTIDSLCEPCMKRNFILVAAIAIPLVLFITLSFGCEGTHCKAPRWQRSGHLW